MRAWPGFALALLVTATVGFAWPAVAQVSAAPAAYQVEPAPAPVCTIEFTACTYGESMPFAIDFNAPRYRIQGRLACGANCTSTYWITNAATGALLLNASDTGVVLATRENQIRLIVPSDVGRQARCCPTQFVDTTYTWDPSRGVLAESARSTITVDDYDRVVQGLEGQGFERFHP
jgi:hypothetical protein